MGVDKLQGNRGYRMRRRWKDIHIHSSLASGVSSEADDDKGGLN